MIRSFSRSSSNGLIVVPCVVVDLLAVLVARRRSRATLAGDTARIGPPGHCRRTLGHVHRYRAVPNPSRSVARLDADPAPSRVCVGYPINVASETIRCVRLMRRLLAGLLLAAVVPPDTATSETPTRHNQLWIPRTFILFYNAESCCAFHFNLKLLPRSNFREQVLDHGNSSSLERLLQIKEVVSAVGIEPKTY